MSESSSPDALLERLHELSRDLYFISESDYPFEVVHFTSIPAGSHLPSFLGQKLLNLSPGTKVEVEELHYFLRNHTADNPDDPGTPQRFRDLQSFLEQQLQDVKVYRVGERKITALVLGKTAAGDYAGLKTTVIET